MEVAASVMAIFGSASAGTAATAAASSAAIGSTVATAGATAATWAGAGSTAMSVLQGLMTAGSVLSLLSGGGASKQEADLQASVVDLQSREQAARIRQEELQKVGAARVAFAGSGVSLASADQIETSLHDDAAFEQELNRNSGAIKSAQIRLSGMGKQIGAYGDAAGSIANYALSLAKRG